MTADRSGTDWLHHPPAAADLHLAAEAADRQNRLTKPPGSLGALETVAIRLAGLQRTPTPAADPAWITVFAADHGVTEEGISAFPREVTAQMVANFAAGGAAISVLARENGATLEVVDVGTAGGHPPPPGVIDARVAPGTANLRRMPAMTPEQWAAALAAGRDAADRAGDGGARIFIGGEMGIGNTTTAAALACALLPADPAEMAGPGTGLDPAGVSRKAEVVAAALALHSGALDDPAEAGRRLGGLEITALAGAFARCAQRGVPVLVDGFITTTAALLAEKLLPGTRAWLIPSHRSAEPGHRQLLALFETAPLLDLGLRLGEGSGAATALPLLRLACALHRDMATFDQAGVAPGEEAR